MKLNPQNTTKLIVLTDFAFALLFVLAFGIILVQGGLFSLKYSQTLMSKVILSLGTAIIIASLASVYASTSFLREEKGSVKTELIMSYIVIVIGVGLIWAFKIFMEVWVVGLIMILYNAVKIGYLTKSKETRKLFGR